MLVTNVEKGYYYSILFYCVLERHFCYEVAAVALGLIRYSPLPFLAVIIVIGKERAEMAYTLLGSILFRF